MASRSRYANPATVKVWNPKSSQPVELQSLTDRLTGAAITTATVTANLYDEDGNAISGISNPVTLSHVGSGTYRYVAPYDVGVEHGDRVTIEWTADDGPGRRQFWRRTVEVQYA